MIPSLDLRRRLGGCGCGYRPSGVDRPVWSEASMTNALALVLISAWCGHVVATRGFRPAEYVWKVRR